MRQTKQQPETIIKEQSRTVDGYEYTYRLTVSISEVTASYRLPLYSISAEMRDTDGKKSEATCADAFADIGKALVFFDMIVRYAVTPIDLAYVYEDEAK